MLEGLVQLKANEFRALTQGAMTVNQYVRKFIALSRYAPEDVNTDKKKQLMFKKGLKPKLYSQLVSHIYPDFNTLVSQSVLTEEGQSREDAERNASLTT